MAEKISKETVDKLRNGDHKAFDKVFIAYFNKIKYFINGLICSEDDAEELTQEIFVKLWINRMSIDSQKSFNAFLYVLARNSAFNYLKHKLVEQTYLNTPLPEQIAEDTEEIIYAKEIALLVEMAVQRMPEKRREIYNMSRNEGLTNEQIASQLSISKKTVENQLSLTLKELRQLIHLFLTFFF